MVNLFEMIMERIVVLGRMVGLWGVYGHKQRKGH